MHDYRYRAPSQVALLAFFAGFIGLPGPRDVCAQSFRPASFSGSKDFAINISSDEGVRNRWNWSQYAPGQNTHRRIVGNSRMYRADLVPSRMDIRTPVTSGNFDRLEAGWADRSPSVTRNGTSLAAMQVPLSFNGSRLRTLQSPGLKLSFKSNDAYEATGYTLGTLRVRSTSDQGTTSFVSLYERVTGVLVGRDDVVTMRVPATRDKMTVSTWTDSFALGVAVYARCNAQPSRTAFHRRRYLTPIAFVELPACTGTWYISLTNIHPSDQVFHLTVGSHKADRELKNIKVGVAYSISATERAQVQQALEDAAWRIYGASQGTQIIRSFKWYQADACDDGWPAEEFACGGSPCNICLHPESGRSNCSASKKMTLSRNSNRSAATIAHEMGHCQLGLPDEYQDTTNRTCRQVNSLGLCGHSIMEGSWDNINGFCTAMNHRRHTVSCTGLNPRSFYCRGNTGPYGHECGGRRRWIDGTSMWDRLFNDGKVRYRHPNRTPDNHNYLNFNVTNSLGQTY